MSRKPPKSAITLDGDHLTLDQFYQVSLHHTRVILAPEAEKRVASCRETLESLLKSGKPFYGINTGFGALASKRISPEDLLQLQINLIRSHTAGVGPMLPEAIVRGIILLRANVLAKGYSGVRPEVVRLLLDLLNCDIVPQIPSQGSVGASGDLAPLAHLASVLIGEGEVVVDGKVIPSHEALKQKGLSKIDLREKEGIALINGTQMMTAMGALNLRKAQKLVFMADIAGAMTLEAQLGSLSPFLPEVHRLRPYPGQIKSARIVSSLLSDSPLWNSHQGKNKVQDAYSIRCIPQVHGAVRETLDFVRRILEIEINAATENPLIFPESSAIVSGGNFHGEPLALAMDYLAIAMAELGNISERRIERLVNPSSNMGLPPFLVSDNGLNSGLMIAHVTASALASENRTFSHPASVDNIPTSANQEDHVSMGSISARKCQNIIENCRYILSIEFLSTLQALDHYELPSSPPIQNIRRKAREAIPFLCQDQRMDVLIQRMADMIDQGIIHDCVEEYIGSIE